MASLTVVPESVGKFTALQTLNLINCTKLTVLPESLGDLGALHTLKLFGCRFTTLPESVGKLGALYTLNLYDCSKLKLPASISLLMRLDEASRKHIEAIHKSLLRGALTFCAREYLC